MRPGLCIKGFHSSSFPILRSYNMLFVKPVCFLLRDARKLQPRTVKPNAGHVDLLERTGYLSSSHLRPHKPLNKLSLQSISKFTVTCQGKIPNSRNVFAEFAVEWTPKHFARCITTYPLPKPCLSVRWAYSLLYNHYPPQLLLSWEVHCENCGIPTMRVRGGTGLRWSLITLALLSATVSTRRGLDKWFTDQQTKTISEKSKHRRGGRSTLKQAEGDEPDSSLILWGRIWKVGGPEGKLGVDQLRLTPHWTAREGRKQRGGEKEESEREWARECERKRLDGPSDKGV